MEWRPIRALGAYPSLRAFSGRGASARQRQLCKMVSLVRRRPMQPGPGALGDAAGPASPRRRWLVGLLLVATFAGALAVVFGPLRPPIRRDASLSVLLITIDTLRADALGCYGRKGAETPWIDRLAERGVRFEQAHAHNVVTLPSHTNLLSGRYPLEHGVRDNTGFRFPATQPTLATLLKASGWQHGRVRERVSAGLSLRPGPRLRRLRRPARGHRDHDRVPGAGADGDRRRWPRPAGGWRRSRGQRFFAFVHLYEPHFPYVPPEPFASRFRAEPYHGEVAAADAALGPLLEPILAAGPAARTLVVLTSDHGESLGEHGEDTHGIFAYEATLHVPLIVYAPGLFSPRVVSTARAAHRRRTHRARRPGAGDPEGPPWPQPAAADRRAAGRAHGVLPRSPQRRRSTAAGRRCTASSTAT